jgi:hypothetical protein
MNPSYANSNPNASSIITHINPIPNVPAFVLYVAQNPNEK